MRFHQALIVSVVLGLSALPAGAQETMNSTPAATPVASTPFDAAAITEVEATALNRFKVTHPGTLSLRDGSQLVRLYGRTFEMGDTPADTAERFLSANAELFGAEAADLLPATRLLESGNTLPLMYDAQTGSYKYTRWYITHNIATACRSSDRTYASW